MSELHYHVTVMSPGGVTTSNQLGSEEAALQALHAAMGAKARNEQARGHVTSVSSAAGAWHLRFDRGGQSAYLVYQVVPCIVNHDRDTGPKTVRAEVWALSADDAGIWLISGDAPWMSADLGAAEDEHAAVERILAGHHALHDAAIVHSTSWRDVDTYAVHTFVAALSCPDVHGHWPGALPVSPRLIEHTGKPIPHAADAAPTPRDSDVLLHAVRHLAFLERHDATAQAAMTGHWRAHLAAFQPALAGMYSAVHAPETISA